MEKLPLEVLTANVADGWEKVGAIKAQIEGLTDSFEDTEKVVSYLEALQDAYLVFLGQMEALIADQGEIKIEEPVEEEAAVEAPVEETEVAVEAEEVIPEEEVVEESVNLNKEFHDINKKNASENDSENLSLNESYTPAESKESWEYFCEFEEPVGEKYTDADLYPQPVIK